MPEKKSKKNTWINVGLVVVIVAIFVVSFALGSKPNSDEEGFGGTDSIVSEVVEEGGYTPWFKPIFEPGSGEIESGLFAMQAALGAALLGFAMGNLRGRKKGRLEAQASSTSLSDSEGSPTLEELSRS